MVDNASFADVSDARALAQAIVDTVREPLLVLDGDLHVVAASRSYYRTFQVSPEDTRCSHRPLARSVRREVAESSGLHDDPWHLATTRSRLGRSCVPPPCRRVERRDKRRRSASCGDRWQDLATKLRQLSRPSRRAHTQRLCFRQGSSSLLKKSDGFEMSERKESSWDASRINRSVEG